MKSLKTYLLAFAFLATAVIFTNCNNDDDATPQPTPIVEASPVQIIALNQGSTDSPIGIWQDTIEINKTCLLTINANASARYGGNVVNAGIDLNIKLNGELVASDFSFEGESSSITFNSSASTTLFLQPGTYDLEVRRFNIAVNGNYSLSVNYHAVYAEMSN